MPLPKLKDIKWVTTDCYGTLIDWEKGILDAFHKEAEKDGFSFEDRPFLGRFFEVQAEIMAGPHWLHPDGAPTTPRSNARAVGSAGGHPHAHLRLDPACAPP